MSATVILGEGFSTLAGLPRVDDALVTAKNPCLRPKRAKKLYPEVKAAFEASGQSNVNDYLVALFGKETTPGQVGWEEAATVILSQLAKIGASTKAHFNHGILTPSKCQIHRLFWQKTLRAFDVAAVVTTCWDILAEQGLRAAYTNPFDSPLFHFGGEGAPQFAKRKTDLRSDQFVAVQLGRQVALCKLRGSMNWAAEKGIVVKHEDVRASFRATWKEGRPLVTPSLPLRRASNTIAATPAVEDFPWLKPAWDSAREHLGRSETWVLCGAGVPNESDGFRELLEDCVKQSPRKTVYLIPAGKKLDTAGWSNWLGSFADVVGLSPLQKALSDTPFDLAPEANVEVARTVDAPRGIGRQRHTEFGPLSNAPVTAFVSYTWEDDDHRAWVEGLGARLRRDGIDVVMDVWDTAPGDYLPQFMERIGKCEFVLIVCTHQYKRKFDERLGGVGLEGHLMTGVDSVKPDARKFLPLLSRGKWLEAGPTWVAGKRYINLTPERFDSGYKELLQALRKQLPKKPPLGPVHPSN